MGSARNAWLEFQGCHDLGVFDKVVPDFNYTFDGRMSENDGPWE